MAEWWRGRQAVSRVMALSWLYIIYICLGSELWAEAINCCWVVAVGRSNILVWANAVAVAVYR